MAKKGKYAHITPNLPAAPLVEDARREVVDAVKQEIRTAEPLQGPPLELVLERVKDDLRYIIALQKRTTGGNLTASELARAWAECRGVRDALQAWDLAIGVVIEAYFVMMIEQFEADDITGLKLGNGQTVSTYKEPSTKVLDKEAFRLWCLEQKDDAGNQRLVRDMVLPWATANALAKAMLLDGVQPPECLEVQSFTQCRLLGKGDE